MKHPMKGRNGRMRYGREPRHYYRSNKRQLNLIRFAGCSFASVVLWNLEDAGASYTRRNIIRDAFIKLGVYHETLHY